MTKISTTTLVYVLLLMGGLWLATQPTDAQAPAGAAAPAAPALTGPLQVAIESKIWELVYDSNFDLGMNWNWIPSGPNASITNADLRVPALDPSKPFGGQITTEVAKTSDGRLRNTLQAAIGRNRATLLASPTIMVANAQSGRFHSGDKIPFIQLSAIGTAPQILETKHDTGVVLEVVPIVRNDNFVELSVNTNISRVIGFEDVSGSRLPIISERTATATVLVKNQGSVILGGLYEETEREQTRSVPILGKVPLLRKAFESTNRTTVRSEVMVEISPTILSPGADFQPEQVQVRKPVDDGDYIARKVLGDGNYERLEGAEDKLDHMMDPDGTQTTQDAMIDSP